MIYSIYTLLFDNLSTLVISVFSIVWFVSAVFVAISMAVPATHIPPLLSLSSYSCPLLFPDPLLCIILRFRCYLLLLGWPWFWRVSECCAQRVFFSFFDLFDFLFPLPLNLLIIACVVVSVIPVYVLEQIVLDGSSHTMLLPTLFFCHLPAAALTLCPK